MRRERHVLHALTGFVVSDVHHLFVAADDRVAIHLVHPDILRVDVVLARLRKFAFMLRGLLDDLLDRDAFRLCRIDAGVIVMSLSENGSGNQY